MNRDEAEKWFLSILDTFHNSDNIDLWRPPPQDRQMVEAHDLFERKFIGAGLYPEVINKYADNVNDPNTAAALYTIGGAIDTLRWESKYLEVSLCTALALIANIIYNGEFKVGWDELLNSLRHNMGSQ